LAVIKPGNAKPVKNRVGSRISLNQWRSAGNRRRRDEKENHPAPTLLANPAGLDYNLPCDTGPTRRGAAPEAAHGL